MANLIQMFLNSLFRYAMPSSEQHRSNSVSAEVDELSGYIQNIDDIRSAEYPALKRTTYLDHAGTTPFAKSMIESWTAELTGDLFGNPHSASSASQLSSRRIDDIRLAVLNFFNADPEQFDVVFVANATAAIKLVGEAFRDQEDGFWYGYHVDSHTSMVGLRELAQSGSQCFMSDTALDQWISQSAPPTVEGEQEERQAARVPQLVGFPGQSNMTGHRPPLEWCEQIRRKSQETKRPTFTLLDAASLASTSNLDLRDPAKSPDFVALSFYKVFGFPDLGALIVRRESAPVFLSKKYFAGGTVELVSVCGLDWHAKKETLHSSLEEGTLPFHNIFALDHAIRTHQRLYHSMQHVSRHTEFLASRLRERLRLLRHANGKRVCYIYSGEVPNKQGPVIAFNLRDSDDSWVSMTEVEKLSIVKNIQLRTGGLCNPGGIARHLSWNADEQQRNFAAGQRCGGGHDIINGKPTGAVRVSLGAMSSLADIEQLLTFVNEFYVDRAVRTSCATTEASRDIPALRPSRFYIESMSVFPVKSCAAFKIPIGRRWEVTPRGLAWDREWCLVHAGTSVALSQKRYPRMALLKPDFDFARRELVISFDGKDDSNPGSDLVRAQTSIRIPLDESGDSAMRSAHDEFSYTSRQASVCGSDIELQLYTIPTINDFFTQALQVPCILARYPPASPCQPCRPSASGLMRPFPPTTHKTNQSGPRDQISKPRSSTMLSNESPILLISRSSVNRLNENIKENGGAGKAVAAASFRGNIVIAEELEGGRRESPYAEEEWARLVVRPEDVAKRHQQDRSQNRRDREQGDDEKAGYDDDDDGEGEGDTEVRRREVSFEILGPCQRCHMVCVDQTSAERRPEPFSTLAKTRRKDGKVWFGMHMTLQDPEGQTSSLGVGPSSSVGRVCLQIGDQIVPS